MIQEAGVELIIVAILIVLCICDSIHEEGEKTREAIFGEAGSESDTANWGRADETEAHRERLARHLHRFSLGITARELNAQRAERYIEKVIERQAGG